MGVGGKTTRRGRLVQLTNGMGVGGRNGLFHTAAPGCSRLSKTPRLSIQRPAMGPWLNAHSATCAPWPSSAPGQRTRSAAAANAKPRPPGRATWTAPGVRHSLPFGYPGYCTAPQQQGLGRGARQGRKQEPSGVNKKASTSLCRSAAGMRPLAIARPHRWHPLHVGRAPRAPFQGGERSVNAVSTPCALRGART